MSFEDRRWIFLSSGNLNQVDFSQLPLVSSEEGAPNSLRYCNDKSKFMLRYDTQNVSGVILGRPDCFGLALTINGKTEWEHKPVLEYLVTEEWTNTGMFPVG